MPQRKPTQTLRTQVSDDGTVCKVTGAAGSSLQAKPVPPVKSPSPLRRPPPPVQAPPPLPPENSLKGVDVDNIKLGEAAAFADELSPCMMIDGSACNEPAPTLYSPNDGTYITCTETMEYQDVPYFPGTVEIFELFI